MGEGIQNFEISGVRNLWMASKVRAIFVIFFLYERYGKSLSGGGGGGSHIGI